MQRYEFRIFQYGNLMYSVTFNDYQKAKNFYIKQSARDDQYTMFLHNDEIKNTAKAEAFFDIKNVKACFCINFESAAKAGRLGKKVSLLF